MSIDFDRVLPDIYVGTYPSSTKDIDRLKTECSITAVLNLQSDNDLRFHRIDWPSLEEHYSKSGIEVRRVPIEDFDHKDLKNKLGQCAAVLDELIGTGRRVYVHCTAGLNRSPTTVIAYLYRYRGYDLETAERIMRSSRTCEPYVDLIHGL